MSNRLRSHVPDLDFELARRGAGWIGCGVLDRLAGQLEACPMVRLR